MSCGDGGRVDHWAPFGNLVYWSRVWIGLLLAGKAADVVTTAVGVLLLPGFVEANPFAAAVFDSVGVLTGLVVLSVLTVLLVAFVTELGVRYLERHEAAPEWGPIGTRVVGYGPLSIVFVAAAAHNTGLIVQVLLVG